VILIDRPQTTQGVLINGLFSDGSVREVTSQANLTTTAVRVIKLSKDAELIPVGDGGERSLQRSRAPAASAGRRARGPTDAG